MENVLITGNMGYIGPVLTQYLHRGDGDYRLYGYDSGFFAHCLTTLDGQPERALAAQHFGDLRSFDAAILDGVGAVVHLAAISNDPIGNAFAQVTEQINITASVDFARQAKAAGVRRFVFASSCSVYGAGQAAACREDAPLDPLTPYAKSKIAMEEALHVLADDDFSVICLRFATACGMSDRLRLDLVLNDFVASAVSTGKIEILSDGSSWRPLIHVQDMARAIEWALGTRETGAFMALNAGSDAWNYKIRDLVQAVSDAIPDTTVSINKDAVPDKRSYKVDFSRFSQFAGGFTPRVGLAEAIAGLSDGLRVIGFDDPDFRQSNLMRLRMLLSHQDHGTLDADLNWLR
mgnify:FL=1